MFTEQPNSSQPPGAAGDEELDPLSRRLFQIAVVLSVLLLLVLANSFLNDGGGALPESRLELNPVASAADQVESFPGMRFSAHIVYSSPYLAQPLTATGNGWADTKTQRAYFTLDMTNPVTGQPMQGIEITDGNDQYLGGDIIEEGLPPGKEWVHTDTEVSEEDEMPLSMEESLEMLDSTGEAALIGREVVNGKMTRNYRAEIELDDFVDSLREQGKDTEADVYEQIEGLAETTISAECWIDGKGLLQRMRIVMPLPGDSGEPTITVAVQLNVSDYGPQPGIRIPEPHTVVEGPLEDDGEAGFSPGSFS